jgi:hypothetical protein
MCEHHAELVIQLVKQHPELGIRCETFHASAIRATWCGQAECPGVTGCVVCEPLPFEPLGRTPASRHSESAKMRIDPPAVRMYSTLPAEIQL